MAQLGDGAVMKVLLAGLAPGPGLHLVHRIAGWIEVVMVGDLGQVSGMASVVACVLLAPGLEFRIRALGPKLAVGFEFTLGTREGAREGAREDAAGDDVEVVAHG